MKNSTHQFLVLLLLHMSYSSYLFTQLPDEKGFPFIKDIFSCIDIPISTLQEANLCAQKNFLLTQDEWFEHSTTLLREKLIINNNTIMHDLKELGMIYAIMPSKKEYSYALVMGSFKDDMVQRFDFLAHLCKKGYFFETIVLLGGMRPLLSFEKEGLPENIITEIELMNYLCKQYEVFNNQTIMCVNAPMIQKADGTQVRPTTESTVNLFAQIAEKAGSCVVISHNPYIQRQTMVVQRILDQRYFPVEGAGPEYKEGSLDIIMIMDEFARMLYEICKLIKN